jgi:hypothetical protein
MAKKKTNTTVCTFCLNDLPRPEAWWVDMIMHRADPNCTSKYSVPSCGKCKDDPENSWLIVGIAEEPQPKKEKKEKKPKKSSKEE